MASDKRHKNEPGKKPMHLLPAGISGRSCQYGLITLLFILFCHIPALAMDVTLKWDANQESDLAGYKIYYGNFSGSPYDGTGAGQGSSPIFVPLGNLDDPDNPQLTITGLDEQEVYYFAVTAYNTKSLESDYSNEVSTDGPRGSSGIITSASGSGGGGGCFIYFTSIERIH